MAVNYTNKNVSLFFQIKQLNTTFFVYQGSKFSAFINCAYVLNFDPTCNIFFMSV